MGSSFAARLLYVLQSGKGKGWGGKEREWEGALNRRAGSGKGGAGEGWEGEGMARRCSEPLGYMLARTLAGALRKAQRKAERVQQSADTVELEGDEESASDHASDSEGEHDIYDCASGDECGGWVCV